MRFALSAFLLLPGAGLHAESLLHPIFQTHAVLQRDAPIRVYGQADAGAEVDVLLANHAARTRADGAGRWAMELPAMPAGGPHTLEARSGDRIERIADLLIGDVWLCSGQSNMVLQVHRTLDARAEIAGSANSRIRMLTVGETGSVTPLERFATPVEWKLAGPDTAAEFSATCFYFARELQNSVDVPMGLVVAAWGGSRIQAWISAEALRRRGDLDPDLDALQAYAGDPVAAAAAWARVWQNWWQAQPGRADDTPWRSSEGDSGWHTAPSALGAWEGWGVPELSAYNGMLWYRSTVELDAEQAAQTATLQLGSVDEIDMTWLNGVGVGSAYGPGESREYPLPAGLLRAGRNTLVVNALDTYRDGGVAGPKSAHAIVLADGQLVAFEGAWHWRMAEGDSPPRAPWHTAAGLSTLYNGMIAPIGRYAFRGVVWYQGESNTFEASRYGGFLDNLIADWRARFGSPLPWLNVQLAGYGTPPTRPVDSGWADLREVQRRFAERDARYGYATAVDIGDRYDIHPPNKQELGRRLSRLARHLVFGEQAVPPSGPTPRDALIADGEVRLRFDGVTEGLVSYSAAAPIGFELCAEARESCRFAPARLEGDIVFLQIPPDLTPTRVRHAWADHPVITLFDGSGQPVVPFELPLPPAKPL